MCREEESPECVRWMEELEDAKLVRRICKKRKRLNFLKELGLGNGFRRSGEVSSKLSKLCRGKNMRKR